MSGDELPLPIFIHPDICETPFINLSRFCSGCVVFGYKSFMAHGDDNVFLKLQPFDNFFICTVVNHPRFLEEQNRITSCSDFISWAVNQELGRPNLLECICVSC